jgi:hypothetical protein
VYLGKGLETSCEIQRRPGRLLQRCCCIKVIARPPLFRGPKKAVMPFSSKAREIHNHIVSSGKADYWIGVARSLVERKGRHQPGKPYTRDVPALKDKLKAEF